MFGGHLRINNGELKIQQNMYVCRYLCMPYGGGGGGGDDHTKLHYSLHRATTGHPRSQALVLVIQTHEFSGTLMQTSPSQQIAMETVEIKHSFSDLLHLFATHNTLAI